MPSLFFSHALSLSSPDHFPIERSRSDYRPMPALDAYDGEDLDDGAEADEPMSFEARARAEAAMARRDQREGRGGAGGLGGRRARLPGVLQGAWISRSEVAMKREARTKIRFTWIRDARPTDRRLSLPLFQNCNRNEQGTSTRTRTTTTRTSAGPTVAAASSARRPTTPAPAAPAATLTTTAAAPLASPPEEPTTTRSEAPRPRPARGSSRPSSSSSRTSPSWASTSTTPAARRASTSPRSPSAAPSRPSSRPSFAALPTRSPARGSTGRASARCARPTPSR